ncbi:hypothetical protein FRC12_009095 [Ceratobasidium sp. 428]|nr:hypothetical protein FRC12_009095 [Ceratobasidium sp. 428]
MSNNPAQSNASMLPYIIAKFEGRAIAIKRDADYQETLKIVQSSIPKLRSIEIQDIFMVATLPDYSDTPIQLTEGIWPDLASNLKTVEITVDYPVGPSAWRAGSASAEDTRAATNLSQASPLSDVNALVEMLLQPTSSSISITICTPSQERLQFNILRPFATIKIVKLLIENRYGVMTALQTLEFNRSPLDDDKTLEECGIGNGALINLILRTRRVAVWLSSPWPNDVFLGTAAYPWRDGFTNIKIQLSLNRAWELAAIHTSMELPIQNCIHSRAWTVDFPQSGDLYDRNSSTSTPFLLWDGITQQPNPTAGLFSASQEHITSLSQTHNRAWLNAATTIDSNNSVLIQMKLVGSYISHVFASFGCRFDESFLNHLLSQLESNTYTHIALRFLHGAESENLTLLDIDLAPTAITRITMLYKGLNGHDFPNWRNSLLNSWRCLTNVDPMNLPTRHRAFGAYIVTWMEIP